ncbi:molybdopterin-guanine dinucleotide biosynthesis protein A [Bacillus manliponensis]|uniref:Probable molybdenum cofactor guanylyltransferase n=1 Tax=Bacillus manliponensis TaxID=574376 RepID=A0A073JW96_9BACI|nr:molybdenum cofactor guanylyltransferase [Bacillus manliponensis]KEK18501.1 molybdopterin-guanine dinucleotide biosynthesis protein A [Bacillus manliponensis]
MKIVGIVLAGGQSRRFGEQKALVKWNGKTFIEHSIEALKGVTEEIVVISHPSITNALLHTVDVSVTEDILRYKGDGPLAGLLTGMNELKADWYIVAPCDTPNISKDWALQLIKQIHEDAEAIIPVIDGRKQPLLALYHRNVKEKIECLLQEEKRSMQGLLSQCHVRYVKSLSASFFFNINTKEEYERFREGQ